MGVLSGLEPKAVFRFFEELCAIPHGSHNTRAISDYLVDFAESHRLKFRRDEFNNVIIWKAPTAGYEHSPAVMIQGHVDMVAEKDADCSKDMEKEGLDLFVDGDLVGARGTTLGGDDGITVAMAGTWWAPAAPHWAATTALPWPWPSPSWTRTISPMGLWSACSPWTRRWACWELGAWTLRTSAPGIF